MKRGWIVVFANTSGTHVRYAPTLKERERIMEMARKMGYRPRYRRGDRARTQLSLVWLKKAA
jgi:hypothetical protein